MLQKKTKEKNTHKVLSNLWSYLTPNFPIHLAEFFLMLHPQYTQGLREIYFSVVSL